MTKTKLTWVILVVLYGSFFSWYTSCSGPLTDAEVEHFVSRMQQSNPDIPPERLAMLREFLETDTGDDFVMVNVIEFRDTPLQVEGVSPTDTSAEVMAKYMEFMFPALLRRACHPVLYSTAAAPALEMFGIDGVREWTNGAGMRYRSRRDMIEIASDPSFHGPHEFKIASMNKTFAFPADPWFHLGDPRLILALIALVIGLATTAASGRSSRR